MTMRRELRETLQWCLTRQRPFTCDECKDHFDRQLNSVNRQFGVLLKMGVLDRQTFGTKSISYRYSVLDREYAERLVSKEPRIRYEKEQVQHHHTPRGISFVFHLGA
jgi:predicted transcriptional regulator